MNWLDLLVEGTKCSESPARYYWWAGIAALGAVARKQVSIDRHFYTLYPNVYVALVSARSGLRKGAPIAVIKGLVEDLDCVRVVSGCNSIQGLTKELGMQKTFEDGRILSTAQGLLVSDEFKAFLTDDPNALTILTALHNTHEHEKSWTKTLKNSPVEVLKSPCLSMLVASNEVLFHQVVTNSDMEGGFVARTFIVYESYRRMVNSLVYPPEVRLNTKALLAELKAISLVKGVFLWCADTAHFYDKWYTEMCQSSTDDRTGTMERLGDQVIKVAMLIELADGAGRTKPLELTLEVMRTAIAKAEECLGGVKAISIGGTSANDEQDKAIPAVVKALLSATDNYLVRSVLLTKTGLDAVVLDRALATLTQRETILPAFRDQAKRICYRLNPEVVATYNNLRGQV